MNAAPSVTEWLTPNYGYSVHYTRRLVDVATPYQRLEILKTPDFGNVLRLDGALQCSEADEFFYHEPLVHIPAMSHELPRNALVIGGGDGGAAEELLKHPSIESVTLVEIDAAVVDAADRYLRSVNGGLFQGVWPGGDRFRWLIGDGQAFMQTSTERYDLIVLDLTDPGGASTELYSEAFYAQCQQRLAPGGILSLHIAAPWAQTAKAAQIVGRLRRVFSRVTPYLASVPLSGGAWLMAHCSDRETHDDDLSRIAARCEHLHGAELRYYTPHIHTASAVLPAYLANGLALNA